MEIEKYFSPGDSRRAIKCGASSGISADVSQKLKNFFIGVNKMSSSVVTYVKLHFI